MLVLSPDGTVMKVSNGKKNFDKGLRSYYDKPVTLELVLQDQGPSKYADIQECSLGGYPRSLMFPSTVTHEWLGAFSLLFFDDLDQHYAELANHCEEVQEKSKLNSRRGQYRMALTVFFRSIKGLIDSYISAAAWKPYAVVSQAIISLYIVNTLNGIIFNAGDFESLTPHEFDRTWSSYYVGYLSTSQRSQPTVVKNALIYLHTICPFCGERGGTLEACSQLAMCDKKRNDKPSAAKANGAEEFRAYKSKLKKAKDAAGTAPFDQKAFDDVHKPLAKSTNLSKDFRYYCHHQDEFTLRRMEDYSSLMKLSSN